MTEIADFVNAQYDRLEALTRAVADSPGVGVELYGAPVEARRAYRQFLDALDEDWVLADIESKREIVKKHSDLRGGDPSCSSIDYLENAEDCETLRLLALPYADRPGYKAEEWAV